MGWVQLVGQGISMIGQKQQGDKDAEAADLQGQELEMEAAQQANKIRRLGTQTRGSAKAALAASGVDVNSGTSALIDQQITFDSEEDAYNTILSGERQANTIRRSGHAAQAGANLSAASTLVKGVGDTYSKWRQSKALNSEYGVH